MAKKSKTQRAKASAARQARKAQAAERESQSLAVSEEDSSSKDSKGEKKGFFRAKARPAADTQSEPKHAAKSEKKKPAKPKKQRFKFFHDVKAEMKRVTWPTRQEVFRWAGVVVAALVFFGIFVAILDNLIITPVMVGLSGIGA